MTLTRCVRVLWIAFVIPEAFHPAFIISFPRQETILKLFVVLTNFLSTTSETMHNYYLQTLYIRVKVSDIVVLRCSSAQDAQAVHHRNFRKIRQAKQIKSKIKKLILTPWSGS